MYTLVMREREERERQIDREGGREGEREREREGERAVPILCDSNNSCTCIPYATLTLTPAHAVWQCMFLSRYITSLQSVTSKLMCVLVLHMYHQKSRNILATCILLFNSFPR